MIYVFDTSSFSKLKHFYPGIFKSVWTGLDQLVASGNLISTKEVFRELENGDPGQYVNAWLKRHKSLFKTPTADEMLFVAEILRVQHFQSVIGEKQRLKGMPVADPFVISCAKVHQGTVVTEEQYKPTSAKIPNICEYFGNIPCITLEQFMQYQNWNF
jgi:hypothetical protein